RRRHVGADRSRRREQRTTVGRSPATAGDVVMNIADKTGAETRSMLEPRHEGAPRRGRLLGALTFVAALPVGCASILGIEDARCDETLDPQCAGGQPDDTSEDDDRDEDTAEAGADSGLADDDDDTDDAAVTDDDTDDLAVTDDDTDDLAVTDEDT